MYIASIYGMAVTNTLNWLSFNQNHLQYFNYSPMNLLYVHVAIAMHFK